MLGYVYGHSMSITLPSTNSPTHLSLVSLKTKNSLHTKTLVSRLPPQSVLLSVNYSSVGLQMSSVVRECVSILLLFLSIVPVLNNS